jgi:dipeptidyl aminopeptidase/acylaminoacyl peptidase
MRPTLIPTAAALLVSLVVLSLPAPAAAGPARWTVDDVIRAESARDWALSPDGALAAWVKTTVEKVDGTEKPVARLWLTHLGDGASVQLTRGFDRVSAPAFSPDGSTVAFLFSRPLPDDHAETEEEGKTQIWAISVRGGEAYPVSHLERSVRAFAWRDDATLVAVAQESSSWWEQEHKERKDDAVVVDDAAHQPPVRLFAVKLENGEARRLTRNDDWIDALAAAPDGRHAVVRAQESLSYEFDQKVPPRTFLVDLLDGAMTPILTDGRLLPGRVAWAGDSRSFYFTNERTRDPVYRTATITELYVFDLASGSATRVDLDWPRGLGGPFAPTPDGVIALLADGVTLRPARLVRTSHGWVRNDLTGTDAGHIFAWALARDGRTLVYEHSTATTPTQWYGARLEGASLVGEHAVTALNPNYEGKPTGKVEVIHFKGAQGDAVEGLLHYPLGWKEGTRDPLILEIHGGPTGTDMDAWSQRWAYPLMLWRQKGAFVLQVNYHGSSGYGLDWVESIGHGKYYDLEVPDLEKGVDAVIARGLADPGRLATAGWSNGGILSAALITDTTRFKAASVGAADVEWFSDWANVDFGASFDNYYFGGAPWEVPQVYLEKSPFFRLTRVTTPTIVYSGTKDRNVPPHESWSLFRALQQIGKAPVRLVLFPGEPHGLRQIVHQRRKVEEDLAWFDRYLFNAPETPNEAVREGSLLASLLARAHAARVGSAYARDEGGVLVPETVQFAGMEVGRFEVTRAQLAAFDSAVTVEPGRENFPATGVSFAQAKAYAAWLAERTGRPFRLPTEAEAARLAQAAGHGGNTLDRWAGYTANPDDAARLTRALAAIPGAPLLLPAGSLPGTGEDPVFDLDGNAAEWAVGRDGEGVAEGPSADRSTDPASTEAPAPAYIGFRVVVGKE